MVMHMFLIESIKNVLKSKCQYLCYHNTNTNYIYTFQIITCNLEISHLFNFAISNISKEKYYLL